MIGDAACAGIHRVSPPYAVSVVVEPVRHYSNKSALLPPPLVELQKLADLLPNLTTSATPQEQVSWSLRRRLEPALVKQITTEYEAGATTPSLCETYGLSKTGILRLLRDEGVALRRRPLRSDQVALAKKMYESGHPIAAIATRLDTSYNNVRQRLIKEGVELRPRGGSYR
ncbi:helix-turn-helix domain-containing protein [uncultured Microbacterium sp.]|uniref:helix-turn-helix domain-containing protein n=1 Tax=uncultured Microbacterium sp. TaxID=191216 RepID=UPI003748BBF9